MNLREKAYQSFTRHLLAMDIRPGQFITENFAETICRNLFFWGFVSTHQQGALSPQWLTRIHDPADIRKVSPDELFVELGHFPSQNGRPVSHHLQECIQQGSNPSR